MRPEDEALYPAFGEKMDPEDVRLRFFSPLKQPTHAFIARLTQLDYEREMALAAVDPETNGLMGVSSITADPDLESAEYAVLVRSDLKGLGLGWALMQRIIAYARSIGLKRITGEVLGENTNMVRMADALGFEIKQRPDDRGIVYLSLSLDGAAEQQKRVLPML